MGYNSIFFSIFTQDKNFFMNASLGEEALLKLEEQILFPKVLTSIEKGGKMKVSQLLPLKVYQFTLSVQLIFLKKGTINV